MHLLFNRYKLQTRQTAREYAREALKRGLAYESKRDGIDVQLHAKQPNSHTS